MADGKTDSNSGWVADMRACHAAVLEWQRLTRIVIQNQLKLLEQKQNSENLVAHPTTSPATHTTSSSPTTAARPLSIPPNPFAAGPGSKVATQRLPSSLQVLGHDDTGKGKGKGKGKGTGTVTVESTKGVAAAAAAALPDDNTNAATAADAAEGGSVSSGAGACAASENPFKNLLANAPTLPTPPLWVLGGGDSSGSGTGTRTTTNASTSSTSSADAVSSSSSSSSSSSANAVGSINDIYGTNWSHAGTAGTAPNGMRQSSMGGGVPTRGSGRATSSTMSARGSAYPMPFSFQTQSTTAARSRAAVAGGKRSLASIGSSAAYPGHFSSSILEKVAQQFRFSQKDANEFAEKFRFSQKDANEFAEKMNEANVAAAHLHHTDSRQTPASTGSSAAYPGHFSSSMLEKVTQQFRFSQKDANEFAEKMNEANVGAAHLHHAGSRRTPASAGSSAAYPGHFSSSMLEKVTQQFRFSQKDANEFAEKFDEAVVRAAAATLVASSNTTAAAGAGAGARINTSSNPLFIGQYHQEQHDQHDQQAHFVGVNQQRASASTTAASVDGRQETAAAGASTGAGATTGAGTGVRIRSSLNQPFIGHDHQDHIMGAHQQRGVKRRSSLSFLQSFGGSSGEPRYAAAGSVRSATAATAAAAAGFGAHCFAQPPAKTCVPDGVPDGDAKDNSSNSAAHPAAQHPRPPQSYAELAYNAISSHPSKEATVQEIYQLVAEKYPFYKHSGAPQWKSCIRHNLSTKKRFFVHNMAGPGRTTWSVCADANPSKLLKHRKVHIPFSNNFSANKGSSRSSSSSSSIAAAGGDNAAAHVTTAAAAPMPAAADVAMLSHQFAKQPRIGNAVSIASSFPAASALRSAVPGLGAEEDDGELHSGLGSLLHAIDTPRVNALHTPLLLTTATFDTVDDNAKAGRTQQQQQQQQQQPSTRNGPAALPASAYLRT